MPKNVKDDIYN